MLLQALHSVIHHHPPVPLHLRLHANASKHFRGAVRLGAAEPYACILGAVRLGAAEPYACILGAGRK